MQPWQYADLGPRHTKEGCRPVRAVAADQVSKPETGLLVECDGVLCDTHREGHRVAFNRAFSVSSRRAPALKLDLAQTEPFVSFTLSH